MKKSLERKDIRVGGEGVFRVDNKWSAKWIKAQRDEERVAEAGIIWERLAAQGVWRALAAMPMGVCRWESSLRLIRGLSGAEPRGRSRAGRTA